MALLAADQLLVTIAADSRASTTAPFFVGYPTDNAALNLLFVPFRTKILRANIAGWAVMSTPDEYRMYARESMESAARAKTEAERQAFLQMAHTWEQAALQLEGCTSSPPTAPIAPHPR
jgi:hypothetical protein